MTGHELGAAVGVGAISAVATGASSLVAGYEDGFLAVTAVAAALAALAMVAVRKRVRMSACRRTERTKEDAQGDGSSSLGQLSKRASR
jgi:hypothetical protein